MEYSTLIHEFQRYGLLPFAGRKAEFDRILNFWRDAGNAYRLRVISMTAGPGLGKSRLVEELQRQTRPIELAVVVRFHPDNSNIPLSMIAQALNTNDHARRLLFKTVESDPLSILEALQRLSSLRPMLLIFEDVHLLPHDSLQQIADLFDSLRTAPLSILMTGRMLPAPFGTLFEPFLIDSIRLSPLTVEDMKEIWSRLFNTGTAREAIETIHRGTTGNPLAIRSALRGVLQANLLSPDAELRQWRLVAEPDTLESVLQQSVEMLSAGLLSGCTADERRAAHRLASLGEIFSREAAELLVPSTVDIDSLIAKQILRIADSYVDPLLGASRRRALTFTHSLLHRYLTETGDFDIDALTAVIAEQAPLYSVLPFRLVSDAAGINAAPETAERAVHAALLVSRRLDEQPGWESAGVTIAAAERLHREYAEQWSAPTAHKLHAHIFNTSMLLKTRTMLSTGLIERLEEYLAQAPAPFDRESALLYFITLHFLIGFTYSQTQIFEMEMWERCDEILRAYPDIAEMEEYAEALVQVLMVHRYWTSKGEGGLNPRLISELRMMVNGDEVDNGGKPLIIAPFLLKHFGVERPDGKQRLNLDALIDENYRYPRIQRIGLKTLHTIAYYFTHLTGSNFGPFRTAILQRILQISPTDIDTHVEFLNWFLSRAEYRQMKKWLNNYMPMYIMFGFSSYFRQWELHTMLGEVGFGRSLPSVLSEGNGAILDDGITNHIIFVCTASCNFGILADLLRAHPIRARNLYKYDFSLRSIVGFELGMPELLEEKHSGDSSHPEFDALLAIYNSTPSSMKEAAETASLILQSRVVVVSDISIIMATIALLRNPPKEWSGDAPVELLDREIRKGIGSILEFYLEREQHGFAEPTLEHYSWLLGPKEVKIWRKRIAVVKEKQERETDRLGQNGLRLTMLGSIALQHPDRESEAVRGRRNRLLLGLLTANSMMRHVLPYDDFCRLASGVEDDISYAKHLTGNAISRLRSLLGRKAILTDGETPILNREMIHVDLLQADELIDTAVAAVSNRAIFKAREAITEAVELVNAGVPFPTLYADFFEAARDDFDNKLRNGVMTVAGAMLETGDPMHALHLLQEAFKKMKEDEEIGALLARTLEQVNRRAEAGRIRIRTAI